MTEFAGQAVFRRSLLQRLQCGDEEFRREGERQALARIRDDVIAGLVHLLNTRATDTAPFAHLPHVADSVIGYGLPDLTSFSPSSSDDMKNLEQTIATAIRRFEPRLDLHGIEAGEADTSGKRAGSDGVNCRSFVIKAVLRSDRSQEVIAFETTVDLDSGSVRIEDQRA